MTFATSLPRTVTFPPDFPCAMANKETNKGLCINSIERSASPDYSFFDIFAIWAKKSDKSGASGLVFLARRQPGEDYRNITNWVNGRIEGEIVKIEKPPPPTKENCLF